MFESKCLKIYSRREKVSLNPVKSRVCVTSGLGKDAVRIGYIKLTTFNQNASGMFQLLVMSWLVG